MKIYVEVAINLPQISETYHYHLPPELIGSVVLGSLVVVPFGKQRAQGVVMGFVDTAGVIKTRPVEDVIDELPALTRSQIELTRWLSESTLAPIGACINLMLPSGLSQRTDTLVKLNENVEIDFNQLSPLEKRIIRLLQKRGDLRGRQIDAAIKHVEWRNVARGLARNGIFNIRATLPQPRVKPKAVQKVALAVDPLSLEDLDMQLSRIKNVHDRRLKLLRFLSNKTTAVAPGELYAQLDVNRGDLVALEKMSLIKLIQAQVWRDPLEDLTFAPFDPPVLTHDQEQAWLKIRSSLLAANQGHHPTPMLLHGVTGSGKTELYLRAVEETLTQGKGALILVPEISLTPQTIQRFSARFPEKVGVIHSQLSEGERYDTWRRVRQGELPVVIGPRSALFAPLPEIGLIVVDECHQDSYDQQDSLPYYRGVETAVACAQLSGAAVILGSATPLVTQYFQAVSGSWTYLGLPKRILAHREAIARHASQLGISLPVRLGEGKTAELELPQVKIVDMRIELKNGNRSIFSDDMQIAIEHVLETHQQAILFLNRRGTATYVFCRECGYVVACPRDDKPLTFHQSQGLLICHTCGYQRKMPKVCPICGGNQIRQMGMGTEKVEQLVRERFPGARTLRWDVDTTRAKGAHEHILSEFTHHKADILVGTQMLAKGLDLPLVTLVGVILAEVGLNLPDYRAAERTFQVLTQVAGRAGRSPLGGKVIVQTYSPDHYAIQTAAKHDYEAFYQQEMDYRRLLRFPPFSQLVKLEYRHHDPQQAEEAATSMAKVLQGWIADERRDVDMIGPVPCFFTRLHGRYRWQIILRGHQPIELLRGRQLTDWIVEVNPPSLL